MTIETISTPGELELPAMTGDELPGLGALQRWADANDTATRLVAQWIFTDLVPLHHWPNPVGMTLKTWPNPRLSPNGESGEDYQHRCRIATASAAGTVLRGMALGLSPNIALEQMHSIHGRIGMMTKMKYALALSRGKKAWDVKLSEDEVICAGILEATGETIEISITMAQARKAGWVDGNAAYGKTPIDMLWARAMSRVLDRIAGDVLFGLASIEDLRDLPDDEARVITRVTASDIKDRTAAAALPQVQQLVPEDEASPGATIQQEVPQTGPPADEPGPDEETGEAVTLAQRRRIGTVLRKVDLGSADDAQAALQVISWIVQRTVPETRDLTTSEADRVIRYLEELAGKDEPDWREQLRMIVAGEAESPEAIASTEGEPR